MILKYGPIPASFCLFSFFSYSNNNFNNVNWRKRRWCAWDSNPGPQDGRQRRNHGAMAAAPTYLSLATTSEEGAQGSGFFFWVISIEAQLKVSFLRLTSYKVFFPWKRSFSYWFKEWSNLGLFYCLFSVFSKQTSLQFLQQIYMKNVHPVYGAGIRTFGTWVSSHNH